MDEQIKILVTDLDGVLTDGHMTIDHEGRKMFKHFHTKDVRAIRELVANGWEVYIVSADGHGSGKSFADKVGAVFYEMRDKSEIVIKISNRPFIGVGDDAWDIPFLRCAAEAYCPEDADRAVQRLPKITKINTAGGRGVIAELLYFLMQPCSTEL